jgi:hypothetical protein
MFFEKIDKYAYSSAVSPYLSKRFDNIVISFIYQKPPALSDEIDRLVRDGGAGDYRCAQKISSFLPFP